MSQTFQIADLTIHRIVEFVAPYISAFEMLPALTPDLLDAHRAWLGRDSLDGSNQFILVYQSYLVRTDRRTILVDTCVGNHKDRVPPEWHQRTGRRFMQQLRAVGVSPSDIDTVLCTHFHPDHVGWNTRLAHNGWVPTFPNARYVFNRAELDGAIAKHTAEGFPAYVDSILPIIEAGRADVVDTDVDLGDEVRVLPTPGHTVGHSAYCFGKGRDHVVMTGDMFHVPLQTRFPQLSFVRDADPVQANATRRALFERYCDTDTLVCTGHFPAPSAGRVKRWSDDGFQLVP